MNRRGFLTKLIGGVAATTAVRTFPFRVFSFPSEIVPATLADSAFTGGTAEAGSITLAYLKSCLAVYDRHPQAGVRLVNFRAEIPESEIAFYLKPENRVELA